MKGQGKLDIPEKTRRPVASSGTIRACENLGRPCRESNPVCLGSIYRRGARRWRKLYRVNGHIFQAKRFNRRAFCAFCQDRIWGLGRQGYKCIQCKLLVHKKCHKLVQKPCSNEQVEPIVKEEQNGETPTISTPTSELLPDLKEFPEPPLDLTLESVPVEDHTKNEEALEQVGSQRQYSLIDFELIRVIGRGSYAKVLMVELKKTRRIYAMKVIKKALVTDDEVTVTTCHKSSRAQPMQPKAEHLAQRVATHTRPRSREKSRVRRHTSHSSPGVDRPSAQ
ncbi:hypothetical protein PR048_032707 [Dryococelus australis]|uniref:Phorbol-ester/DAG-type domain-containing protein n=1 Tax=Dryococelus australis TaxID=614101 RepID=A0ABQ9G5U7_9NEOP|nr:hypothetical protein PR048_032707 [Dryococelus australis]